MDGRLRAACSINNGVYNMSATSCKPSATDLQIFVAELGPEFSATLIQPAAFSMLPLRIIYLGLAEIGTRNKHT
jgi:hypothetical protein